MTNGYIVLTKGESNLYKHAVEAITLGKPIYYADGNKVAFVNSIELVSTDVVIKTSDKQITVASDGTTTAEDSGLRALVFDSNNLVITGASQASDTYFTLITSLNVDDLSDLPNGTYAVVSGSLDVNGDLYNIISIERSGTDYKLVTSDGEFAFTISSGEAVSVIKL